jgi:hypothetical protein
MSFEFFNTSSLAFGSKLTAAFKQLENSLTYALENVDNVLGALDYYQQYIDRNYRVPVPTRPQMAVRTNEIYSVVDEMRKIKKLEYDTEENKFKVNIVFYNSKTHKITNAIGETTLKEGCAFVSPAPSNNRLTREIRFSEESSTQGSEILLFRYRIDSEGRIFLLGNLIESLNLYPQDATQYTSLSKSGNLAFPYTATDYECICVVGYRNNFDAKVNGTSIIKGIGGGVYDNINHAILYVKKGDVISGTINFGFKVNYNF